MISMLADPAVFAVVAGLLGLMVGSFLNVVVHRLPIMMERDWAAQCAELRGEAPTVSDPLSLAKPRSRCPKCGHAITALDTAARALQRLRRTDFLSLSACRSTHRTAVCVGRRAFRFHGGGHRGSGVHFRVDCPDRHRF
jgi:hypothetical protein